MLVIKGLIADYNRSQIFYAGDYYSLILIDFPLPAEAHPYINLIEAPFQIPIV